MDMIFGIHFPFQFVILGEQLFSPKNLKEISFLAGKKALLLCKACTAAAWLYYISTGFCSVSFFFRLLLPFPFLSSKHFSAKSL